MPGFDVFEGLVAIRAVGAFTHLNRLDDLWTLYLREPGGLSPEQADVLAQITGEMRDILARAGDHAEQLQRLIKKRRDDFEQAFNLTLRFADLGFQRVDLEQVVQEEGGFAPFAIKQLGVIRELSRSEAESLEAKMAHIREHGITEGDLGQRFKCALLVALLAASIAAMVSTGTIFFPPIVAAIASGASASTLASLFIAHHGTGFILEATHVAVTLAHSVEKCFKHQP
jgi:hypothetical protein